MSLWERLNGWCKPDPKARCGARVNVLFTQGSSVWVDTRTSCHRPHGHGYDHVGDVYIDVSYETGHPGGYTQSLFWVEGMDVVTLDLGPTLPHHKREKFPFTVVSDEE